MSQSQKQPDAAASQVARIAGAVHAALGVGKPVQPFSKSEADFDVGQAYRVVAAVRRLRERAGARAIGRKIGFSNHLIWAQYDVDGPLWNFMYDNTLHDIAALTGPFSLQGLAEPRIEPEIALHLSAAPAPGMDEAALLGCIDWVAHGFELVQSIFPGWRFAAADAIAAFGLHGAYLLGPRHPIGADRQGWGQALNDFKIELQSDTGIAKPGHARNVLGGPVRALRYLVEEIAKHPAAEPLRAGEIVTTGTLTEAMPVRPGETWRTRLERIPIAGLEITLA